MNDKSTETEENLDISDDEVDLDFNLEDQNDISQCHPLKFGNNSQENPIVIGAEQDNKDKNLKRETSHEEKYDELLKNRKCFSQFSDKQLLHIIHPNQIKK